MKKLFFILGLIGVLLPWCESGADAQVPTQTTDLIVVYNNAQQNATFTNTTKFYFSNNNLVIVHNGNEDVVPVSDIQRLELNANNTSGISTDAPGGDAILLYPNPTADRLYFSCPTEKDVWVAIYSLSGQLLQRELVNTSGNVNVSSLSKGFYIINIEGHTYKFSKL